MYLGDGGMCVGWMQEEKERESKECDKETDKAQSFFFFFSVLKEDCKNKVWTEGSFPWVCIFLESVLNSAVLIQILRVAEAETKSCMFYSFGL